LFRIYLILTWFLSLVACSNVESTKDSAILDGTVHTPSSPAEEKGHSTAKAPASSKSKTTPKTSPKSPPAKKKKSTVISPFINGAFLYFGNRSYAQIPANKVGDYLDELKEMGIDELVISSTRKKVGSCTTGTFEWDLEFPGKILTVLDAAKSRSMGVYIGLTSSSDACPAFDDPTNAAQVKSDTHFALGQLSGYLTHSALRGWYIPDEPGLGWSRFYSYYQDIVSLIRAESALPIAVSPYLALANDKQTPATVATMAYDFKVNAGIDVQIWQDSMGVQGPMDLGWNRPGSLGSLEQYMAAISDKLGKAGLWTTAEAFSCCVAPFDGVFYTPASVFRIANQLKAERPEYVAKRFVWLHQYHMGTLDPNRKPESERLKAAYMALAGISGKLLHPVSYEWSTAPSEFYPDTNGTELFDQVTADPMNYANNHWIGIDGSTSVIMDFGLPQTVRWIGLHLMNLNANFVFYPKGIVVSKSNDGQNWQQVTSLSFPYTKADGEYVFGNQDAFSAYGRYLKVDIANTAWTFISEMEIVAD
jgi:hypothetical protein